MRFPIAWFGCLLALDFLGASVAAADLDRDKLNKQLIQHEGKKNKVYIDTKGNPTIGVGFNLNRSDAKSKIEALGLNFEQVKNGTQELNDGQIGSLLAEDIDGTIADCKAVFPEFTELSEVRQRSLVDMMFNLGKTKFVGFKKLIAAVNANDFVKAADEMKNSKWYVQVKDRGKTLEAMMRSGVDPDWLR